MLWPFRTKCIFKLESLKFFEIIRAFRGKKKNPPSTLFNWGYWPHLKCYFILLTKKNTGILITLHFKTFLLFKKPKFGHLKPINWTYLQILNYRWIIVYGFSVYCFSHSFSIKGKLLHCLLLCKIWSLIEQLSRCLVLEPWHMEKPRRRTNFCSHGDIFVLWHLGKEKVLSLQICQHYNTTRKHF